MLWFGLQGVSLLPLHSVALQGSLDEGAQEFAVANKINCGNVALVFAVKC